MLVRRIARPLLSAVFISGGIDALRNPAQRAQAAAPLIDKSTETLPESVTQKIPSDPETLVKINAAVQIGGGILLATGKAPRLASLALAGSLVPTTVVGHDFWNETDPAKKAAQRTQFLKNVSLLGGLLIAAVDTEGKPSLGWRGRRAARHAQETVAAALPLGSGHDHHGPEIAEALAVASERARILTDEAAERGSESSRSRKTVAPNSRRSRRIAAPSGRTSRRNTAPSGPRSPRNTAPSGPRSPRSAARNSSNWRRNAERNSSTSRRSAARNWPRSPARRAANGPAPPRNAARS